MKKTFDTIQNKMMDIIIPSLIVILGMLSILFFFYSIVIALEYNASDNPEIKLVHKKKILYSILIELVFVLFVGVVLLNLYLLPLYPTLAKVIIFSLLLFFGVVVVGVSFSSLWHLSKMEDESFKKVLKKGLMYFYLSAPTWIVYIFGIGLTILLALWMPATLIITPGLNIMLIHYICKRTNEKIQLSQR